MKTDALSPKSPQIRKVKVTRAPKNTSTQKKHRVGTKAAFNEIFKKELLSLHQTWRESLIKLHTELRCLLCGSSQSSLSTGLAAHHWYIPQDVCKKGRYSLYLRFAPWNGAMLCPSCHLVKIHTYGTYSYNRLIFIAIEQKFKKLLGIGAYLADEICIWEACLNDTTELGIEEQIQHLSRVRDHLLQVIGGHKEASTLKYAWGDIYPDRILL